MTSTSKHKRKKKKKQKKKQARAQNKRRQDDEAGRSRHTWGKTQRTYCKQNGFVSRRIFSLHPKSIEVGFDHGFSQLVGDLRTTREDPPEALSIRKRPRLQHSIHQDGRPRRTQARRGSPPQSPRRRRLSDALIDFIDRFADCPTNSCQGHRFVGNPN